MGLQGSKDCPGDKFSIQRRYDILAKALKPEEEKICKIKLADWRKNETKEQLQASRKYYHCPENKITSLDKIKRWSEIGWSKPVYFKQVKPVNEELNKIISLYRGDITCLEVDSIVNAANTMLLGGGGIDGAIHGAAGYLLMRECAALNGLKTGFAKITKGHKLPARYIIHTVGPTCEDAVALRSCYHDVLTVAQENHVKTVALCCISTGIFGYPLGKASQVAMETVRTYLETNNNYKHFERIIFVVFLAKEERVYNWLLPVYFPVSNPVQPPADPVEEEEKKKKEEEEAKKAQLAKALSSNINTSTTTTTTTTTTTNTIADKEVILIE